MPKCQKKCEIYSRVVGYIRPTATWNKGKKEEFKNRKPFSKLKYKNNSTKEKNHK